jgi:ATP-dependent Lon protease
VQVDDAALQLIISRYTREAGVRNLEREIGALLRNAAVRITEGRTETVHVGAAGIAEVLGAPRFEPERGAAHGHRGCRHRPRVDAGGRRHPVRRGHRGARQGRADPHRPARRGDEGECPGRLSRLVKARADSLGLGDYRFDEHDLHVHVPAGAIPKDGPSAGVALFTALASLLTGRKVRSDVAMTGEISLRGLVLPVGGIKEKALAALRAGIHTVLLPARNRKDLEEIPDSARAQLQFIWLETVDDALRQALE